MSTGKGRGRERPGATRGSAVRRAACVVFLGFVALPGVATAATIGKVTYPGSDLQGTPIQSFGWGVNFPLPLTGGGGGGVGKAAFTDIEFTKRPSATSPAYLVHVAKATPIPTALVRLDESPLEICVQGAVLTRLETESRGSKLIESVSMGYRWILLRFDTGIAQIPVGGFDLETNAEWNGPCP
jgi:hypothetical protein